MSIKKVRGNCDKCGKAYMMPIHELPLHAVDPGLILCYQCCKKQYFWDKNRCPLCSERTMCKGRFRPNMIKQFNQAKGV